MDKRVFGDPLCLALLRRFRAITVERRLLLLPIGVGGKNTSRSCRDDGSELVFELKACALIIDRPLIELIFSCTDANSQSQ